MPWWERLLDVLFPSRRAFTLEIIIEGVHMATKMVFDDQKFGMTLRVLNGKGNPAKLASVPTWTNSDPAVATVTPASDGLTAALVAVAPGITQVKVLGVSAGGRTLEDALDVTVEPGEATTLQIVIGPVEAQ